MFPTRCPEVRLRSGRRGRRGRRPLHRRPDLPGPAVRAAAPFRQPRRARHRGPRREDHRRSSSSSAGCKSPADIFRLHKHRDELLGREGWKEKSVDNLLAAIEAKRAPDAARLLFGLGIRHVGDRHRARPAQVLRHDRRQLRRAASAGGRGEALAELTAVEGVGPGRRRGARSTSSTRSTTARRSTICCREVSPQPFVSDAKQTGRPARPSSSPATSRR